MLVVFISRFPAFYYTPRPEPPSINHRIAWPWILVLESFPTGFVSQANIAISTNLISRISTDWQTDRIVPHGRSTNSSWHRNSSTVVLYKLHAWCWKRENKKRNISTKQRLGPLPQPPPQYQQQPPATLWEHWPRSGYQCWFLHLRWRCQCRVLTS